MGVDMVWLNRVLLDVRSQHLLYENIWLKRRGGVGVSLDNVAQRRT